MSRNPTQARPFGKHTEETLQRVATRLLPGQQAAFFSYLADLIRQGLKTRCAFIALTPSNRADAAEYAALSIAGKDGERRHCTDYPALVLPDMLSGRPVTQANIGHRLPYHPLVTELGVQRLSSVPLDSRSGPATIQIGVLRQKEGEPSDAVALKWLADALRPILLPLVLAPAVRALTARQLQKRYLNTGLAVAATDTSGRLLHVSEAFCDLLDQPAHRLLHGHGREAPRWIADNDLRALMAAAEPGQTVLRCVPLQRHGGDELSVLVRIDVLKLDDHDSVLLECLQAAERSEALLQPLTLALLDEPVLFFQRSPLRIRYANPAACRYFGFQAYQLGQFQRPQSVLFENAETLFDEAQLRRLCQQSSLSVNALARRAGGERETRRVKLIAAGLPGDDLPEQWMLVCEPGEDPRRIAHKLHLYEQALEACSEGMALANRNLRIVHHNSALADLFRCWAGRSLLGRRLDSMMAPFEQARAQAEILPELRHCGFWQGEVIGRRMDGTEFPQHIQIRWLDSGDCVITVRDQTVDQVRMRRLEQAERKYRQLFDNAPHGMYQTATSGRIISANRALAQMLGYRSADQLSERIDDVGKQLYVDPSKRRGLLRTLIKYGAYHGEVFALRRIDGGELWVNEDAHVVCDDTGRIRYFEGTLVDITEQYAAEQALKASEKKFRQLIENAHDGVVVLVNQTIRYANRALAHLCRRPRQELVGKPFSELLTADQQMRLNPRHRDPIQLSDGQSGLTTTLDAGNEPPVDVFLRMVAIDFEGESALSVSMRDITEQKRTEAEMERLAFNDALTSLPNREGILRRIDEALLRRRRDQAMALLFLDLDGFKLINDGLGHALGDALLVALSERLRSCVEEHDHVGRYGGDEFVILLADVKEVGEAEQTARRILRALRNPFELTDHTVYTNASIGIEMITQEPRPTAELLRNADIAMYRAKRQGKGRFAVFSRDMHRHAHRRLTLENELRQAVERREFRLYYQPIVDLKTRRLKGFESLLRWEHPERGIIVPGDFLDVAEETGVMDAISRTVTRDALAQLATWHKSWPDFSELSLSINISNRQFASRELPEQIRRTLLGAGVDPARIHLEITEKVFMDDPDFARETFNHLRGLGVKLLMDDFGTGFSSLSALRHLPIDILKIDRAFVANVEHDSRDLAVIRTIVQLAHELNMQVIAEGIETPKQAVIMQELGCHYGQGFLFGAATPPQIAEERLRHPRAL
jgi:diguanylate cyclase (GGDEF)-like protein/PAS domain S-box-containing protein